MPDDDNDEVECANKRKKKRDHLDLARVAILQIVAGLRAVRDGWRGKVFRWNFEWIMDGTVKVVSNED
jgi:hypothetical protein